MNLVNYQKNDEQKKLVSIEKTAKSIRIKINRVYELKRNTLIKSTAVMAVIIIILSMYLMETEGYWALGTAFCIFGILWLMCFFRANFEKLMKWIEKETPDTEASDIPSKNFFFSLKSNRG